MEIEIKVTTGPITIPAMAPPDNQLLDVTLLYNPTSFVPRFNFTSPSVNNITFWALLVTALTPFKIHH